MEGSLTEKGTGRTATTAESTYKEFSLYNLFWVFMICCIIGVLFETVLCLIREHELVSRRGVIYGPFNQVYGLGGAIMTLVMLSLRKKGTAAVILGVTLTGGIIEWLCSYIQEILFGTVSWDYTGSFMSIGGRTNFTKMLCWGVMGMIFVLLIYPLIIKAVKSIPTTFMKPLTISLAIFMALNLALSALAVHRMKERDKDIPASTKIHQFLDYAYPDSKLNAVFPNMKNVSNDFISTIK